MNADVISLKLGPASWVPKATRSVSSILKPEPVAVLFAHSGCYPKGGALVPQLPNVAKLNACNSYQHIYAMLEYYEFSSILIEKLTNESSRNSEMPFT